MVNIIDNNKLESVADALTNDYLEYLKGYKEVYEFYHNNRNVDMTLHKRIVCGVTVDNTDLYKQINYWKCKYEEAQAENKRLIHVVENILKESQI